METITITITAGDELVIAADSLNLGTQYDNKAHTLEFIRPEGYEADYLYLVFQTSRYGMTFAPIGLGKENAFVVTNLLTQGERLHMQVMFVHGETEIRSNTLIFEIRASLPSTKAPPLEIPVAGVSIGDIPGLQEALGDMASQESLSQITKEVRSTTAVVQGMASPEVLSVLLVDRMYPAFDAALPIEAGTYVYSAYRAWRALVDMEQPTTPAVGDSAWALAEDEYTLDAPVSAFSMIRVSGYTWYAETETVLTQDIVDAMIAGPVTAGAYVNGFSVLWGWPAETPATFFALFGIDHWQTWQKTVFELT